MAAVPEPQVSQSYLDEYSGSTLVGVCALFIALETTFLGLRFYARRFTDAQLGWYELLLPLAWVTNVGLCSLCINAVYVAGVGRHVDAIVKADPLALELVSWGKSLVALEWLYLASNALPKIYMLNLYLRLFTHKGERIVCYFLIGFIATTWLAYQIASATKCRPFAFQWDKTIPGGYCVNVEAYYQSTSVPNLATDVIILVLPIRTVLQLQASPLRKFGLFVVFLVGSVSCVRLSIFFRSDAFTDETWESVSLMSWSCIEPGMYLISACLVQLRPLLQRLPLQALRTKISRSKYGRQSDRSNQSSMDVKMHRFIPTSNSMDTSASADTGSRSFRLDIEQGDHQQPGTQAR